MSRGIKNITEWEDIETMSYMTGMWDHIPDVVVCKDNTWKWLELIQRDGKIRAIDIIRITAVVENAFAAGLAIGEETEK